MPVEPGSDGRRFVAEVAAWVVIECPSEVVVILVSGSCVLAVLSGAGGGGGGKGGVAGGEPAEPDELPRSGDDQCGLVGVLVVEVGPVGWGCGVAARCGVRRGAGRG